MTSAASAAREVTVDATAPVASPVAEVKRAADGASVGAADQCQGCDLARHG